MTDVKPILESSTIRWLIASFVTYIIRIVGLPMLPPEVHGEVVAVIILTIDLAIPAMMALAAWGRIKATAILKPRWAIKP